MIYGRLQAKNIINIPFVKGRGTGDEDDRYKILDSK